MTKKRRRHTPEQIIRKLEEGHRPLAAGSELCVELLCFILARSQL